MKKRSILVAVLLVSLTLAMAVGLTACKLNLGAPVDVTYDGTVIKWDGVLLADHYLVQINDGEAREIYNTSMVYDAEEKDFTVTIVAMPEGSGRIVKANTTTKDFTCLGKINDLKVADDGSLSWGQVARATAYIIRIGDSDVDTVEVNAYSKLPVNENMEVSLRPVVMGDSSYYSLWSDVKKMKILGMPQNITYDNSIIRWDAVTSASSYKIIANSMSIASKDIVGSSAIYNANNVDFDCTVQAIGDHTNTFDSAITPAKKFIYLDTVTNMQINDGIVSWDAVEKATGYVVTATGGGATYTYEVAEPQFAGLSANVNYSVSVCPICDNTTYFSSDSTPKFYEILSTPDIDWDSGVVPVGGEYKNIFWNVINQAVGYTVKLVKPDGEVVYFNYGGTSLTTPAFEYDFGMTGTYEVSVKAMSDSVTNPGLYDSAYSAPIKVVRLAAPEQASENFIVSTPDNFKKGFTVTFKSVSNSGKYKFYFNNSPTSANILENDKPQFYVPGDMIMLDGSGAQAFNCHIQSLGKGKSVENDTIIVSLDSNDTLDFKITIGAVPSDVIMEGYDLTWNDAAASGYGFAITSGGSDIHRSEKSNSYDMGYLEAGNYEVAVCAMGNGGTTLASPYSNPIAVTRLGKVNNVQINTSSVDEGKLTFDALTDASAEMVTYKVAFDDVNTLSFDYNSLSSVNQYISTKGTVVLVWAECNQYNTDSTRYFMSSKPSDTQQIFYRLNAPTIDKNAFASQTSFTWNAPADLNLNVYTPSYYIAENVLENTLYSEVPVTSNTFNLSSFEAGTYKFYVKAIGDGKKYVNSNYSDMAIVTKLETPTISTKDGSYVWRTDSRLAGMEKTFVISIGGKAETLYVPADKDTCIHTPKFDSAGNKDVSIYAKGSGVNGGTINSDTTRFTQVVKQLDVPTISSCIVVNANGEQISAYESGAKLRITITYGMGSNCKYARSFGFTINGTAKTSTKVEDGSDVYDIDLTSAGEFSIRAKAKGVGFDAGDPHPTAYIDSTTSNDYTIVVLYKPSGFSYIKASNKVAWAEVAHATKYEYQISYDGGEYGEVQTASNSYFIVEPGTHSYVKVRVRAIGNATGTIVSSEWAEYTKNF